MQQDQQSAALCWWPTASQSLTYPSGQQQHPLTGTYQTFVNPEEDVSLPQPGAHKAEPKPSSSSQSFPFPSQQSAHCIQGFKTTSSFLQSLCLAHFPSRGNFTSAQVLRQRPSGRGQSQPEAPRFINSHTKGGACGIGGFWFSFYRTRT